MPRIINLFESKNCLIVLEEYIEGITVEELLDMDVAKWFDPEKKDDTRYMGTQYYAAPEQLGYGMRASFSKSDIYAVGMLLNVMITG